MAKKTFKSVNGTSFHGTCIRASYAELEQVLGPANYQDNGGGDKVNFEWNLETEDGEPFTVYDWKEYRRLRPDEQVEWHIGGHNGLTTITAKEELNLLLAAIR